ncbi:hypothetical protein VN0416_13290 [Helicobacter pylori]
MAVVVKVVNGKIQEFENGNYKRTYGSNIVAADTWAYCCCCYCKG